MTAAGDWEEHPEAREELFAAQDSYLDIDSGILGDEFISIVESTGRLITRWPGAGSPYDGNLAEPPIRTFHLGKFPYNLVYAELENRIFVLAYAHEKRRPGYWKKRLRDA